jgi:serine phosphatase RsbU (regulator of sigma subunit)
VRQASPSAWLLGPAMRLMNRLNYPQKFGLIGGLLSLTLGLVMTLWLAEVQKQVNFTRQERLGVRYLLALQDMAAQIPQYQLDYSHLERQNRSLQTLLYFQAQIDQDFQTLRALDREIGPALKTTAQLAALEQTWQTLVRHQMTWSPETVQVFCQRLQMQLRDLRLQVGEQSNLILEPELDAYYAMDTVLLRLPEIRAILFQIQLQSQSIGEVAKVTPVERSQFVTQAATLKALNEALEAKLNLAIRQNSLDNFRPEMAEPLKLLSRSLDALTRSINKLTYTSELPQPDRYLAQVSQSFSHSDFLWERTIEQLDRVLQHRIRRLVVSQVSLAIFVLLIAAIVVYLFIAFYLGVMQTVSSLSAASKQMVSGNLSHPIQLDSRDELVEVVQSFKTVAEALVAANQEILQLNQSLTDENLRMSTELDITRRLQSMLLPTPTELAKVADLEIAGHMEPAAEVGGDYYDVIQENGKVQISIGDVTGHGLESGVVMIMVQAAVRALFVNHEQDAARFFNAVNRTIYDNTQRMNSDKLMTLALLEYESGTLRLMGQHEELILVRSNGSLEQIDTVDLGVPLGLEPDITPFIAETKLYVQPGDLVVLYTDGITEARNREKQQYGTARLHQVLRQHYQASALEVRQAVLDDVQRHLDQQPITDDMTLLVLKRR